MSELTWVPLPTSTPNITLMLGNFASPVDFVSLEQNSPGITFIQAYDASGQMLDACVEYNGQGYDYQGTSLVSANCLTTLAPNTYQFNMYARTDDITKVLTGAYLPSGPPSNISYGFGVDPPGVAQAPVSAGEPSTLALLGAVLFTAALYLYSRFLHRLR